MRKLGMAKTRIFDALLLLVPEDAVLTDIIVGIHWIFVQSQHGCARAATAYAWDKDSAHGNTIEGAGDLIGMRIAEIASRYDSASWPERALALAAVSSALPPSEFASTANTSAQDYVAAFAQAFPKAKIAIVGHFKFVESLRALGANLMVFELEHRCTGSDLPHTQIPQYLPDADLIVMTASTLITHSCEEILRHRKPSAISLLVGPTAPVHKVLGDFGISAICGSKIANVERTKQVILQGGGHRQLPLTPKSMIWLDHSKVTPFP